MMGRPSVIVIDLLRLLVAAAMCLVVVHCDDDVADHRGWRKKTESAGIGPRTSIPLLAAARTAVQ